MYDSHNVILFHCTYCSTLFFKIRVKLTHLILEDTNIWLTVNFHQKSFTEKYENQSYIYKIYVRMYTPIKM